MGGSHPKGGKMRKVSKKYEEMSIDEKINNEIDRLNKIYTNIQSDKKEVCKELIRNAAFLSVTLRTLQQTINEGGVVEEYNNGGGQSGTRIAPSAQIYSKLIANYNAIIKQLVALLPASDKELARLSSDPMLDYLNS